MGFEVLVSLPRFMRRISCSSGKQGKGHDIYDLSTAPWAKFELRGNDPIYLWRHSCDIGPPRPLTHHRITRFCEWKSARKFPHCQTELGGTVTQSSRHTLWGRPGWSLGRNWLQPGPSAKAENHGSPYEKLQFTRVATSDLPIVGCRLPLAACRFLLPRMNKHSASFGVRKLRSGIGRIPQARAETQNFTTRHEGAYTGRKVARSQPGPERRGRGKFLRPQRRHKEIGATGIDDGQKDRRIYCQPFATIELTWVRRTVYSLTPWA